jgi:hypothetical protein
MWGDALSEWNMAPVNSVMWWTDDGRRAAYTVRLPGGGDWKMLLADDVQLARDVLAVMKPDSLAHHPAGWLTRNVLDPAWASVESKPCSAAMAFELQSGILNPYTDAVAAGERQPGFLAYPLPFIAC